MAQEEPNRFVEWLNLVRKQGPVLRQHLTDWLKAVGEEPTLIWHRPAVRYAAYGLTGLILLLVVMKLPGLIVPPRPASARPEATTADFHVVCSDSACGHHFVINRKFGYRKFPVRCPHCGRDTGMQARKCNSKACLGRWVAPQKQDGRLYCPRCAEPLD